MGRLKEIKSEVTQVVKKLKQEGQQLGDVIQTWSGKQIDEFKHSLKTGWEVYNKYLKNQDKKAIAAARKKYGKERAFGTSDAAWDRQLLGYARAESIMFGLIGATSIIPTKGGQVAGLLRSYLKTKAPSADRLYKLVKNSTPGRKLGSGNLKLFRQRLNKMSVNERGNAYDEISAALGSKSGIRALDIGAIKGEKVPTMRIAEEKILKGMKHLSRRERRIARYKGIGEVLTDLRGMRQGLKVTTKGKALLTLRPQKEAAIEKYLSPILKKLNIEKDPNKIKTLNVLLQRKKYSLRKLYNFTSQEYQAARVATLDKQIAHYTKTCKDLKIPIPETVRTIKPVLRIGGKPLGSQKLGVTKPYDSGMSEYIKFTK